MGCCDVHLAHQAVISVALFDNQLCFQPPVLLSAPRRRSTSLTEQGHAASLALHSFERYWWHQVRPAATHAV
eukprot:366391-Chlamydomonas_euryale.AAC.13